MAMQGTGVSSIHVLAIGAQFQGTDLARPVVYSILGIISLPFSSFAFEISNRASSVAMAIQAVDKAKCFPGHPLCRCVSPCLDIHET
jgi:hypothetical protein